MIRETNISPSHVRGVQHYQMKTVTDAIRGNLTVGEFGIEVPFIPARYFVTHSIPSTQTRGEHAHRTCEQFLVCVHGSCSVTVDDGHKRESFRLDHPGTALYIPAMVWAVEFDHSRDSALLVLASHRYDPDDYIRDYEAFLREVLKP